jgi:A/G-specific adenine glycosylase
LLDQKNPALHNQAIMEFGALQCKPVSPNCSACPVLTTCSAHRENQVALLPVKLKKVKVRKRFFVYHLQQNAQKQLAFQKRGPKDIWEGLFEFPLTEFADENQFKIYLADQKIIGGRFQHVLTHQRIEAYFVRAPHLDQKTSDLIFLDLAGLQDHPIPRLIDKFLIAHSDELF